MKITDFLPNTLIAPALQGQSKAEILSELAKLMASAHPEIDPVRLEEVLWDRERLGSTAIGDGIAIPHGKLPGLKNVIAAFGRHVGGAEFQSLDGKPSQLFFLLVAPEDSVGLHLKALARVSRLLKNAEFRQRLLAAADGAAIYRAIEEEDNKY